MEALLSSNASSWEFDAFQLNDVTQGHGLSTLGFYLMHEMGLMKRFKVSPQALARWECVSGGGSPGFSA